MENGTGQLTELERVKLENFTLKHNLMQQQLQANMAERIAFIRKIEESNPGYQWDDRTGLTKTETSSAPAPKRVK
jgi:hypothetical protein